jgi:hypothetical protein
LASPRWTLWDIAGKAANAPVYRLLGGGGADLACYASLVRYSDPALVRANVRRALDAGFRSLKLHEIELSAIRAAREKAGPHVELTLKIEMVPAAVLPEIARQIVFVQALHDDHDRAFSLSLSRDTRVPA